MSECGTCDRIAAAGYNAGPSHCRRCHRSWTGIVESHCAGCHRQFSTVNNFAAHRVDGVCVDPSTLVNQDRQPRFKTTARKHGDVWVSARDRPDLP